MWECIQHKGVQRLLDSVIHYLPSPADVAEVSGTLPNSEEIATRPTEESAPLLLWLLKL